jgi:pimeloyl-ACP methyl ester carboxylesterase
VNQFATLGQSGGGPFSLATSAVLGDRVVRVGVASGAGPFQLVPGAIDSLDENDRVAVALLPGDPVGAANGFAAGFEPLVQLSREASPSEMAAAFQDQLSPRDCKVMQEDRFSSAFATTMREALCQGTMGQRLLVRGLGRRRHHGRLPGSPLVWRRGRVRTTGSRTLATRPHHQRTAHPAHR